MVEPLNTSFKINVDIQGSIDLLKQTIERLPLEALEGFRNGVSELLSDVVLQLLGTVDRSAPDTGMVRVFTYRIVGLDELCATALAASGVDFPQGNDI